MCRTQELNSCVRQFFENLIYGAMLKIKIG